MKLNRTFKLMVVALLVVSANSVFAQSVNKEVEKELDLKLSHSIHTNIIKEKYEQKEQFVSFEIPEEIVIVEKQETFEEFYQKLTKDKTQLDLRLKSNITSEDAELMLKGTELEGLGKYFVIAENQYNVNALYLIAHAAWESEWGKSKISKVKNNLFGYQAYDKNPMESAKHFETKEECIMEVAKYISEHYLNEDGKWYNGSTLVGMNVRYASDDNWSNGISNVMNSLIKRYNNNKSA